MGLLKFFTWNGVHVTNVHLPWNEDGREMMSSAFRLLELEGYGCQEVFSARYHSNTDGPAPGDNHGWPITLSHFARGRQMFIREIAPGAAIVRVVLRDREGETITSVPFVDVFVRGEFNIQNRFIDCDPWQVLEDAWSVMLEETDSRRQVLGVSTFRWASFRSINPPSLRCSRDMEIDMCDRFLRHTMILREIRAKVNGDLDDHIDEAEDLPMIGSLPENERTFGLEIEFLANGYPLEYYGDHLREVVEQFGSQFPVQVTGYAHSDGQSWHLKTDSSCGYELATPGLTWEEWPVFEAILRKLYEVGARIDDRCGVHVHHSADDLGITGLRRLILLWAAYERVLLASVKSTRNGNRYCQTFLSSLGSWEEFRDRLVSMDNMHDIIQNLGRYYAFNATTWWSNGRIEIRLHHGTLHPGAVKFWTLLTQQMIEYAKSNFSYNKMERAFGVEFHEQIELFKRAITNGTDHPEVLKLPMILEHAIRRRNKEAYDSGVFKAIQSPPEERRRNDPPPRNEDDDYEFEQDLDDVSTRLGILDEVIESYSERYGYPSNP